MEGYKLTKDDYSILMEISQVAQKVLKINQSLSELEINYQNNSSEYKKLLSKLKTLTDEEKELYSDFDDPNKISESLSYILDDNVYDISEVLQLINMMENSGLIKARIAERLEMLLGTIGFQYTEIDDSEEFEYPDISDEESLEPTEIDDPDVIEEHFFYSEKLARETERDILNTALKILNEYLLDEHYVFIRTKLIEFKYRMAFLFEQVESEFLNREFNINPRLYWGAKLIVDMSDGDTEDLEVAKNSYAEEMLYAQMENLMNMKNKELNDLNNYSQAIISEIIIRAALLFVSDEIRDDFKNFFLAEYECEKGVNLFLDNIISNTFSQIDQDKELPWILSLKPKH